MTKVNDWLEAIPSQATRKSYTTGLRTFEKYYGKDADSLIGSSEAGKVIEKFYVWLKEQGYSQNSARVKVNAVIQFLKYFDTPVKYRKSLGIYRSEIATDHILQIGEVQQMYAVADLREKVILEVFLLGLRARDASRLEWELFSVEQEAPIPIVIRTRKEGVNAHSFISQEFKELLEKYLPQLDSENKYLLQTARKGYMVEDTLNRTLKNLAERAGLKTGSKIHWHLGRKLVMRTCAQLGINQWSAKMLVGKSIPRDIETYINGVELKDDYLKVSKVLCLSPKATEESENLKEALTELERENRVFKTRIDNLQEQIDNLPEKIIKAIEEEYPQIKELYEEKPST